MNVQDVIEKALAGNDGIPVTPVEHSSCEDVQVEKLASALNFIAVNLESSYEDLEKVAASRYKRKKERAARRLRAKERFRSSVDSQERIPPHLLPQGPYGPAPLVFPEPEALATKTAPKVDFEPGKVIEHDAPEPKRVTKGSVGVGSLSTPRESAPKKYAPSFPSKKVDVDVPTPKKLDPSFMDLHGKKLKVGAGLAGLAGLTAYGVKKYRERDQKKTASVDDILYHAAQVGKQSLLEKVAEDRINPAKISAGPADPYSGEIMPNAGQVSNEFVGNTRDHHALIALKAQKVRNRINKDMKQYVTNVGDGYNLQGHLSKMNK